MFELLKRIFALPPQKYPREALVQVLEWYTLLNCTIFNRKNGDQNNIPVDFLESVLMEYVPGTRLVVTSEPAGDVLDIKMEWMTPETIAGNAQISSLMEAKDLVFSVITIPTQ